MEHFTHSAVVIQALKNLRSTASALQRCAWKSEEPAQCRQTKADWFSAV